MEELKSQFTDIDSLGLCKSGCELFSATYQGNPVIIKAILNHSSYEHEYSDDWLQSCRPNEVTMYQHMKTINSLQQYIPKYYTSIMRSNTEDYDHRWLLEELEELNGDPQDLGCHAYLVIERVDGVDLEETFDWSNDKKEIIFNNLLQAVNILKEQNIRHGDLMETNVLVREDCSICLIDFEDSDIDECIPHDYKPYSYESIRSLVRFIINNIS